MTPRQRITAILTTWPFVASLTTLLLNDFWLKRAIPGMVTGKLSDFAGIAVVTLLLLAGAPRHRRLVHVLVAAGFAFWKSPLSQACIDAANDHLPWNIGRVVDYSDLLALLVMPLCQHIARRPQDFVIPGAMLRRLLLAPVAAAAMLGIMATTLRTTKQEYQFRHTDPAAELNRDVIATAVADVAREMRLKCQDCADPRVQARYQGNNFWLSYSFSDGKTVNFRVEALPDGLFLGDTDLERANQLTSALKARLSKADTDLEYVERLAPRAH